MSLTPTRTLSKQKKPVVLDFTRSKLSKQILKESASQQSPVSRPSSAFSSTVSETTPREIDFSTVEARACTDENEYRRQYSEYASEIQSIDAQVDAQMDVQKDFQMDAQRDSQGYAQAPLQDSAFDDLMSDLLRDEQPVSGNVQAGNVQAGNVQAGNVQVGTEFLNDSQSTIQQADLPSHLSYQFRDPSFIYAKFTIGTLSIDLSGPRAEIEKTLLTIMSSQNTS